MSHCTPQSPRQSARIAKPQAAFQGFFNQVLRREVRSRRPMMSLQRVETSAAARAASTTQRILETADAPLPQRA